MISSKNTAEAAIKAAFEPKSTNEIFCVTDSQDYTLKELVDTICVALKNDWQPFHVPLSIGRAIGRIGDSIEKLLHLPSPINSDKVRKLSSSLTFSCEKAKQILGYEPKETLIEGILREVEWLKATHGWK